MTSGTTFFDKVHWAAFPKACQMHLEGLVSCSGDDNCEICCSQEAFSYDRSLLFLWSRVKCQAAFTGRVVHPVTSQLMFDV